MLDVVALLQTLPAFFCCISYFMMVVLLLLHNRPAWAVGWYSDVMDGLGNSLWLCSFWILPLELFASLELATGQAGW